MVNSEWDPRRSDETAKLGEKSWLSTRRDEKDNLLSLPSLSLTVELRGGLRKPQSDVRNPFYEIVQNTILRRKRETGRSRKEDIWFFSPRITLTTIPPAIQLRSRRRDQ